jgi:hypothetical protein
MIMPTTQSPSTSPQKWTRYDEQTVVKETADGQSKVDHGRSAVENLREAGRNVRDALDPTNHFRSTWSHAGDSDTFGIGQGIATLMIPWDLAREVLDVPLAAFKVTKNVGDAAVHGVMAGVAKLTGR